VPGAAAGARFGGAAGHRPAATRAGRFPAGAEAVVLSDKGDACFGYAVNLDWPDGSAWGYAPFAD
jgi:hypothetical protein